MSRNFIDDVKINIFHLEDEIVNVASVLAFYLDKQADAILDRDEAEQLMKRVAAEIGLSIRAEATKKPTEGHIDNMTQMDPRYRKAQDALNEAEYRLNRIKAAVKAIDTKGKSLENLTKLHINGVHAEPRVPHTVKEQMREEDALNRISRKRQT